jgi:uncharacterized protein YecE (DUF72 family)
VYPEGSRREEFLALYARRFATVELNFSYYAMPQGEQLGNMLLEGGQSLRFSIKAHRSLTHQVDGRRQETALAFIRALEPLREAERLEAVLFQFPFSFHYEPENRRYLDKLLGWFSDVPAAVEFRNGEWNRPPVFEGLRERKAALVSPDLPDLRGLPPAFEEVTAPLAYVRFHGRNAGAFWEGKGAARYNYRYSRGELQGAGERITRIAQRAERVLVYFNNHPLGQAVFNAEELRELLSGEGPACSPKSPQYPKF